MEFRFLREVFCFVTADGRRKSGRFALPHPETVPHGSGLPVPFCADHIVLRQSLCRTLSSARRSPLRLSRGCYSPVAGAWRELKRCFFPETVRCQSPAHNNSVWRESGSLRGFRPPAPFPANAVPSCATGVCIVRSFLSLRPHPAGRPVRDNFCPGGRSRAWLPLPVFHRPR